MLTYPEFEQELMVVKNTTSDYRPKLEKILSGEEILFFQELIRRIPIPDNVLQYAVSLATKTRPNTKAATKDVNSFCLLYTSPSPRDRTRSRMPSSA